jgi:allantoinase
MLTGATVVAGGTVVTTDGPVRADLVIRDQRFAAITSDASDIDAARQIDASGLVIVPGGIDVHTHFWEPMKEVDLAPRDMLEGFDFGSRGALAGGITTVVEMPHATPPATRGEHIRHKKTLVEQSSRVDVALWGGVIGQPLDQVQEMIDEGVVALKAFMVGSRAEFPAADDRTLLDVFRLTAPSGIPFGIHAENQALVNAGMAELQAAGRTDPLAHAESRTTLAETEAIHRAIFFAERTGGRLYVVHCATAEGLALIKSAQARGVRVEAETCPQYLSMDLDDLVRAGPFARCVPPLRERAEVERIWEYVANGTIAVVASDHCGYPLESKELGLDNIWEAPNGFPGVQTMFPLLFDEVVNRRKLGLQRFVELSATNPARIFSLFPRKGVIQVGSDADLAFYDPAASWEVRGADLRHRHKWTPLEGKTIGASLTRTMLRGEVAFDRAQPDPLIGEPGSGRFLPGGYGVSDGATQRP